MRRVHGGVVGAGLVLALLAGCAAEADGGAEATQEAIVGGIETVAPGFEDAAGGLTAQVLVDAITSVGGYTCAEAGDSAWECAPADPAAGSLRVTGSSAEDLAVTGEAPVDEDTVWAIADAVGADAGAIYSDDGLAWPES
jgi:hypothetical protein